MVVPHSTTSVARTYNTTMNDDITGVQDIQKRAGSMPPLLLNFTLLYLLPSRIYTECHQEGTGPMSYWSPQLTYSLCILCIAAFVSSGGTVTSI